jgi:GNAT superfamily N-acetyltransferase
MIERLIIKDTTFADAEAVAALVTQLGYPTSPLEMQMRLERISEHADYKTIVAQIDGRVVGFAGLMKGWYFEHNESYARIIAFVIGQDFRNQSIGKQLLNACEEWAASKGAKSILLNSGNREERLNAHAFYQKMGYSIKSLGFVKKLSM